MSRKAGAEHYFSDPLPDSPWPVAKRNLLTNREQSFYQRLLKVYPHHKILVQVALSQLIDVDRNHRDWRSIRARYKQLVADFVLCRPHDLSIVAVIELDDRSHELAHRKDADGRKNKVLADAGIRLVRIPAGDLPSENALRRLIEASESVEPAFREEAALRLADTAETFKDRAPMAAQRREADINSRVWRNLALKVTLAGVLAGGWFIYVQCLPRVVQGVLQPVAARHVMVSSVIPQTVVLPKPAEEVAVATRRVDLPDAKALRNQKDLAWAAAYSAPTSCEHPVDWNAQVECGNQYMRARRRFEAQWAAGHGAGQATQATAEVLDNGAIGGARN